MPYEQIPKRYAPDAIHLIRTTQQIQVQLSAMADHKASILIGATFVVFTITLNQTSKGHVAPEMLVLAAFALLSAAFAVMAVLPAVKPTRDAPLNLLFFGSFTQLDEDDYVERLVIKLGDEEEVYRAMARDIYQNGAVLKRKKYRYLALAYQTFLAGMVMTVITFGLDRLNLI